jgi:D-sedoheptulose 7-phosphate isomerase
VKDRIKEILEEHETIRGVFFQENTDKIIQAAGKIASAMASGRKLLIAGNGGSAADAQHMAAEFVNRFQMERRALPAIALTTDASILTSVANDYSFRKAFSRQIEALGKKGDLFLAISTSGESNNILDALQTAKAMGIETMALLGRKGGPAAEHADFSIIVPHDSTPRIQEFHILVEHILCELVEQHFAPGRSATPGGGDSTP